MADIGEPGDVQEPLGGAPPLPAETNPLPPDEVIDPSTGPLPPDEVLDGPDGPLPPPDLDRPTPGGDPPAEPPLAPAVP
jgi:hypothetical protein